MPSRAYTSFLRRFMISTDNIEKRLCQCPLGLIPHFYTGMLSFGISGVALEVSMPSRAYTSFLHLGTLQRVSHG